MGDFDVAVVAIGADVEASILTTANLAELGCRDIVAKALTLPHARILEKVGAHRVIFPEHEMGVRLGNALAGTNLIDYMELDPATRSPRSAARRARRPDPGEADVRGRFGVIVLCIKTGPEIDVIPDAGRVIERGDVLVLAGPTRRWRSGALMVSEALRQIGLILAAGLVSRPGCGAPAPAADGRAGRRRGRDRSGGAGPGRRTRSTASARSSSSPSASR